ncbi:hypothetical protein I5679_18905 [Citrobacter koseri]|uniref:hypothetical protein n=1 Tax=Citrobacter koseri TaxID=545 RepID=UPI001900C069|nr:hypothetical protein [Citrobacter koseri]MBJ9818961.1 hypothetical protein [Citrobacter koseri]HBK3302464.1 hypothetical protein [Citrobacter koseri]
MSIIKSRMIEGIRPNAETLTAIKEQMGIEEDTDVRFMALEVQFDRKIYYCALSGGKLENGEPILTLVGQAALEVIINHPSPNNTLVFQQVKLGETPLKTKVKATLRNAPANSKICFFGDMQGELDGVLSDVFNIKASLDSYH